MSQIQGKDGGTTGHVRKAQPQWYVVLMPRPLALAPATPVCGNLGSNSGSATLHCVA